MFFSKRGFLVLVRHVVTKHRSDLHLSNLQPSSLECDTVPGQELYVRQLIITLLTKKGKKDLFE